ncbi:MAG TPA: hypothetical protein VM364_04625 [Vicinamibacterales bacterium]|nr:hypothetical protein [Vicinamibacterales bacterium]
MTEQLLQSADAARLLDLTPEAIRIAARQGRIAVAMETPRGVRLFTREAVEEYGRSRGRRRGRALQGK